jgi:hypothetical protein
MISGGSFMKAAMAGSLFIFSRWRMVVCWYFSLIA